MNNPPALRTALALGLPQILRDVLPSLSDPDALDAKQMVVELSVQLARQQQQQQQ